MNGLLVGILHLIGGKRAQLKGEELYREPEEVVKEAPTPTTPEPVQKTPRKRRVYDPGAGTSGSVTTEDVKEMTVKEADIVQEQVAVDTIEAFGAADIVQEQAAAAADPWAKETWTKTGLTPSRAYATRDWCTLQETIDPSSGWVGEEMRRGVLR